MSKRKGVKVKVKNKLTGEIEYLIGVGEEFGVFIDPTKYEYLDMEFLYNKVSD